MAIIKVLCSHCDHSSELRPAGVHLWIYDHGIQRYSFFCPNCTNECTKDAPDTIVNMLLGGGVDMTVIHVPLEFLEKKLGPPISPDDVMDFVVAIRDQEYLQLREPEVEPPTIELPEPREPKDRRPSREWFGPV